MVTIRESVYDVFPRIDVNHCYICNAQIHTRRVEGDKAAHAARQWRYCFDNFVSPGHLDLAPLLCGADFCRELYNSLPTVHLSEERVPLRTQVTFDGGSLYGLPTRMHRPEIIEEDLSPAFYQTRILS